MEKIKDSPSTLFLGIGVIICCILSFIPIFRSLRNAVQITPPTPLSEIVLKPEDLTPGLFLWTGRNSNCSTYLFIQSSQDNPNAETPDCYQVKYSTNDNSTIVLNAIWRFDNTPRAEFELNRLIELMPAANNIQMSVPSLPFKIGDKSSASTAIITGAALPIYVTNLYWRQGATVVRLCVISNQNLVSLENMMIPAQKIEERLNTQ